MNPDEIGFVMLFLGGVTALPSAVLLYVLFTDDGATKRFYATPRQSIREARAADVVKVVGRATASEKLVGPFSGKEVVWYSIVVTESERYLEGTTLRERITRHLLEKSRAPFTITDESGASARIVVDGEESFPKIATSETIDVGAGPLPPRVQAELDRRGIATRKPNGERLRLVCKEAHIAPGDTVTVLGPGRRVPSTTTEATGYREAPTDLVIGERVPEGRRMFVFTNGPESALASTDRAFLRITWSLCAATVLLLGGGGWLFWR